MTPGKKPASAGAQQKAQHEKGNRPADQREGGGDDAPGEHDARDPGAGAEPLEGEVAGYFEDEISDEEDAGAEAIGLGVDADSLVHLQRGETDIHAVDVTEQVGGEQERHQAPGNPAHGGGLEDLVLGHGEGHFCFLRAYWRGR